MNVSDASLEQMLFNQELTNQVITGADSCLVSQYNP